MWNTYLQLVSKCIYIVDVVVNKLNVREILRCGVFDCVNVEWVSCDKISAGGWQFS